MHTYTELPKCAAHTLMALDKRPQMQIHAQLSIRAYILSALHPCICIQVFNTYRYMHRCDTFICILLHVLDACRVHVNHDTANMNGSWVSWYESNTLRSYNAQNCNANVQSFWPSQHVPSRVVCFDTLRLWNDARICTPVHGLKAANTTHARTHSKGQL